MHVGKRKDASLWRAHGVDVDEVEQEARVCLGVLSYIGLSHPHFAIHILLGLFSRFGLTVLILPFPLVNHFSGRT